MRQSFREHRRLSNINPISQNQLFFLVWLWGTPAVITGCLWQWDLITQDTFDGLVLIVGATLAAATICFIIAQRQRHRFRYIDAVETYMLKTPVFGETFSVSCVIPARRALLIRGASACLFWEEFAVYDHPRSRDEKRRRLLIAEHHAGDGKFQAGDVPRHEIPLQLSEFPPAEAGGDKYRIEHTVPLILELVVTIDNCPEVRELYKVAVLH